MGFSRWGSASLDGLAVRLVVVKNGGKKVDNFYWRWILNDVGELKAHRFYLKWVGGPTARLLRCCVSHIAVKEGYQRWCNFWPNAGCSKEGSIIHAAVFPTTSHLASERRLLAI